MKFKTNAFAHRATRAVHLATGAGLLAALAMACMPQTMRAQEGSDPWVLDDFSTGAGKLEATSGEHTLNQTGADIIGGTRSITILYGKKDKSAFGQESVFQVRPSTSENAPSALIWSNGFDATPEFVVEYPSNDTPLNLNVTSYDRFRLSFEGLSTGVELLFEVWYGGSFQYFGPLSCPLTASNSSFTVDLPFSAFTPGLVPITWNSLDQLTLQFSEGTSPLNSPNLAITGFSALMSTDPAGTVTCPTT